MYKVKLEADIKKKKINTRESKKKPGAKNDIEKRTTESKKSKK